MQLFKNNAYSTLGASLSNVATALTVAAGQGDRFPVVAAPDFALVTLQDAANNIEIVKVTARVAGADSMTIVRAQENTPARAWALGSIVELRLTAAGLGPLSVMEGATTAAEIRANIDVPTRTGGNASGVWDISITGNAATATASLTAVNAGTAAACSGNSATATALATPRAINGTNFSGTGDITTASWGTARTLTIGATGKAVSGAADVAWSLDDIGVYAKARVNQVPVNATTANNPGECRILTAGITLDVGLTAGAVYSFYNETGGAITLTQGAGVTLRLGGSTFTGNRTLQASGLASLWARSANEYVITGAGLS